MGVEPLTIGAYSFIGAKSSVLPGCNVGRAVIVSAHSLVTKAVPDFAIVAGSPAKIIGDVRDLDRSHIDEKSKLWDGYQAVLGSQPR